MTEEAKKTEEFRVNGADVWSRIKALFRAGNVRHVVFKNKKDEELFSMTLTIAVILAILIPQLVIIATIIMLLASCSIVVEKEA